MRRRISISRLPLLVVVLVLDRSLVANNIVEVETFRATGTLAVELPGRTTITELVFEASSRLTELRFTPGAVDFRGEPIDFSGTEASFLASRPTAGSLTVPVDAGPTVTMEGTEVLRVSDLGSSGKDGVSIDVDLGPSFGAESFDLVVDQSTEARHSSSEWNSTVIPELNGEIVSETGLLLVAAVDAERGEVELQYRGAVLAADADATLVEVETFVARFLVSVRLPAETRGRVAFEATTTWTSLEFTPGAVDFRGEPVDFDATEADFLTGQTGSLRFPVSSGPATVRVEGTKVLRVSNIGSSGKDGVSIDVDLGPSFGAESFDLVVDQSTETSHAPSVWNSTVIPELNGAVVSEAGSLTIDSVDPLSGRVEFRYSGAILTEATPPVEFKGLEHTALGNARLLVSGGHLVVSNIGSSGQDGVSVDLGGTRDWMARIEAPPPSEQPPGAFVEVRSYFQAPGAKPVQVSSVRVTPEGDVLRFSSDFSAIGSKEYRVVVLLSGKPVDMEEHLTGDGVSIPPLACEIRTRLDTTIEASVFLASPTEITILGHKPVSGDQVLTVPQRDVPGIGAGVPGIGGLTTGIIQAALIREFRILEETVGGAGGAQLPGDCNQDARLDISDVICLAGVLFRGKPPSLPCDGFGPGDVGLADWNADIAVDLSDVIGAALFLFQGGPRHPLAGASPLLDCVPIAGCPDNDACAP